MCLVFSAGMGAVEDATSERFALGFLFIHADNFSTGGAHNPFDIPAGQPEHPDRR